MTRRGSDRPGQDPRGQDPRGRSSTARRTTGRTASTGGRRQIIEPDPAASAASSRERVARAARGLAPRPGDGHTVRVSSNPRSAAPRSGAAVSRSNGRTREPRATAGAPAAPPAPHRRPNRPATASETRAARAARRGPTVEPGRTDRLGRVALATSVRAARGVGDYFARTTPRPRSLEVVPDKVTRARTGRRLVVTLVALALLFTMVIYKLADLQVLNAGSYAAFGESQRFRTETLAADRGAILDRNGTPLALSTPQKSVFVDPKVVEDAPAEARLLADALGLDAAEIEQKMTANNRFNYIARQIPVEVAAKVKALKAFKDPNDPKAKVVDRLKGVEFIDEPKRYIPSGDLAKSIVGQVDIDGQGISGLEKMYGNDLTGTPGQVVLERSPEGKTIAPAEPQVVPAVKGKDVQLTIDRSLQFDTERILGDQVREAGAKSGIAVVMKPDTGEVLSMASVVGDQKTGTVQVDGNNAAMTTSYEPGSVMKMITASGAIENGKVQPDTVVPLSDTLQICDSQFSEHDYHGNVGWPVSKIISQSSNVGTIKLGQMIGKNEIYRYMREFGIGQKTAIDFPNEQAGELLPPDKWWCSSNGSIPIGQGVAVTPLQMLVAYNAIANGGVYVAPKLVQATIEGDGSRHPTPTDEGHRVVSRDTANKMNVMLRGVVEEGTGTSAAIAGYTPAGKTGTARKPQPGGTYIGPDGQVHYQATFVGFVPAEAPALSIIVIIDDPSKEGIFGGVVAAPAFSKIGETALREFAVPPPSVDLALGGVATDASKADPAGAGAATDAQGAAVQRTADGRIRGTAAGDPTATTLPATTGATSGSTTVTTKPTSTATSQPVPTTAPRVTATTTPTTRAVTTQPPKRP